ncbi:MAG: hypothetical protein MUD12_02085 [Spirochaetes bacterium]|nr:hypothetical protein [Spirochaetota bacterium]
MKNMLALVMIMITMDASAGAISEYFGMGSFEEGAEVRVFFDRVNVRSRPDIKDGGVISCLGRFSRVKILKKHENTHSVDGFVSSWYEVSFSAGGKPARGYVWGGFFSIVELPVMMESKKGFFAAGMKSRGNGKSLAVEAVLVIGDRETARIEFDPIYIPSAAGTFDYSVSGEIFDGRGLPGIRNVMDLRFMYPACGYPFGSVIILYDGKNLVRGFRTNNMTEAGVFHEFSRLVFPDEKDGIRDRLVYIETGEDFDEVKKEYILKRFKKTVYRLNGGKFEEMTEKK